MKFHALTQRRPIKILTETINGWVDDRALGLSAALAYYSVFSIAPLLIIAISISGLVFGEDAVRGQLDTQLRGFIGVQAADAVQALVRSAAKPAEGRFGAAVGFITLLLGASGVFGQLKNALNTIWKVKPIPGVGVRAFLIERLLNFGMVLVIGFLLLISLVFSTALAAFNGYIEQLIGLPVFGVIVGFLVSFGIVTLLFAYILKVMPDAQVEWRNVWVGAIATAVLFELGKYGLSFYLGREGTASSFGAAGSLVLVLLWVYYASCILLFGAEFTHVYSRYTGPEIMPVPGAEFVTAEDRAQQGLEPTTIPAPAATTAQQTLIKRPEPASALNPQHAVLAVMAAAFVGGVLMGRGPSKPT